MRSHQARISVIWRIIPKSPSVKWAGPAQTRISSSFFCLSSDSATSISTDNIHKNLQVVHYFFPSKQWLMLSVCTVFQPGARQQQRQRCQTETDGGIQAHITHLWRPRSLTGISDSQRLNYHPTATHCSCVSFPHSLKEPIREGKGLCLMIGGMVTLWNGLSTEGPGLVCVAEYSCHVCHVVARAASWEETKNKQDSSGFKGCWFETGVSVFLLQYVVF